jgi:sugar phosphate isomerase/epimerase
MKLAAQLYTVREYTQTPQDIKKTFKKVKDIGYNAVQISAIGQIEPELLKEYADEYGLKICATHTAFDRIVNDTENVIREHKLWGCKYVGLGGMKAEHNKDKNGYDEFLKVILPAAEKLYAEGLKFMYHNHRHEFKRIDGALTGIGYLAQKTEPEKFGFLADFYWVQAGGVSSTAFIKDYADRLDVVHFKDMMVVDDTATMAEIFEGNMDYDSIYNECIKAGVEWVAIEQDICSGDPFDSLKISFDNLKERGMF